MASTRVQLRNKIRSKLREFTFANTTLATSGNATTGNVRLGSVTDVFTGDTLQIDDEMMYVTSGSSTNPVYVKRGYWGTTAATHVTASNVYLQGLFHDTDINSAINSVIEDVFDEGIYQVTGNTSHTTSGTRYEYTVPSGIADDDIFLVEYLDSGTVDHYIPISDWTAVNSKVKIGGDAIGSGYTLRLTYAYPYGTLATDTASLGIPRGDTIVVYGAMYRLIEDLIAGRLAYNKALNRVQELGIDISELQSSSTLYEIRYRDFVAKKSKPFPGGWYG